MKKIFILLSVFALLVLNSNATVRTVSNNTDIPAQYNNLQTAIDAASAGDTILVAGSATSYGNITIGKKLVVYGAGYNNPFGNNSYINILYLVRQNASIGASGSRIRGFYFQGTVYISGSFSGGAANDKRMENIVIERCRLDDVMWHQTDVIYSNDTIRNCLLQSSGSTFYAATFNNIIYHNNIFDASAMGQNYWAEVNLSSVYLRNNIILNYGSNFFSSGAYRLLNVVVENNIFYSAEPQGCYGCTFNHNITYNNSNNVIPGTDNSGSGNLIGIDPQFTNYPFSGGAFSYGYNFTLKSTSPGIDAGTDNSDIGISGGLLPFTPGLNPKIPQMTELKFPDNASSVKAGGTLNVSFKAKKQD
jgi:hypothetical protein